MRLSFAIILATLIAPCFGQNLKQINSGSESYYRVLSDSIDFNFNYPDGRYKLYETDTIETPIYIFNVKNGNVEGPYLKQMLCSWTTGNYHGDSLWTFLTNPNDTSFKIGTWRHYICGLDIYETTQYEIPYDSSGAFKEIWQYENGLTAREAIFKKGFGLEKETYWDFETNEVKRETINSGTKNYYHSIVYENDSVAYVTLVQNGIVISINFKSPFCQKPPCLNISVDGKKGEDVDTPITSISIDGTKTLTEFDDNLRGVHFYETEDGNIAIEYSDNNGKLKYKELIIK